MEKSNNYIDKYVGCQPQRKIYPSLTNQSYILCFINKGGEALKLHVSRIMIDRISSNSNSSYETLRGSFVVNVYNWCC